MARAGLCHWQSVLPLKPQLTHCVLCAKLSVLCGYCLPQGLQGKRKDRYLPVAVVVVRLRASWCAEVRAAT